MRKNTTKRTYVKTEEHTAQTVVKSECLEYLSLDEFRIELNVPNFKSHVKQTCTVYLIIFSNFSALVKDNIEYLNTFIICATFDSFFISTLGYFSCLLFEECCKMNFLHTCFFSCSNRNHISVTITLPLAEQFYSLCLLIYLPLPRSHGKFGTAGNVYMRKCTNVTAELGPLYLCTHCAFNNFFAFISM